MNAETKSGSGVAAPRLVSPCICDLCCLERAQSRIIHEERMRTVVSWSGGAGEVERGNCHRLRPAQTGTHVPCDHKSDGELGSPGPGGSPGTGIDPAPEPSAES